MKSARCARLRRDGDRGDHGVAAVVVERVQQRVEAAHLDGAGDLHLLADQPREIDIEAGRIAVGTGIVERRIVDLGEEADQRDARRSGRSGRRRGSQKPGTETGG